MVTDVFQQDQIIFKEDTHQYFNQKHEEYQSVSSLLKGIKVPFDRQGISYAMAIKEAGEKGISVELAQKEILAGWDKTKDSSIDKGNYVHDGLENYAKKGIVDPKIQKPIGYMRSIFKECYRFYPEVMLYSHRYMVAGRTDIVLQRQKSKRPVFDFLDYKTNESKGIQFDSVSRKDGVVKHFNKYFLPPFDYLEDCNYVNYSLQLSVYAFMAMDTLGMRIGKLGIVFVGNDFETSYIPVPFMMHEAKILCERNIRKKELPQQINYAPVVDRKSTQIKVDEITDDW